MLTIAVGLGNNNPQYAETYHNVGFLMIDWWNAQQEESSIALHKTTGFMNESGAEVKKILREANAAPEELLVVHDDSDIELGSCKLSFDRGAAGHKGVQNVIDQIGTKSFYRLRIGIRPRATAGPRKKANEFVLKNISKTNLALLEKVFAQAREKITAMVNLQK